LSWRLKDTIRMDDVASVVAERRLFFVQSDDGREISINVPMKEAQIAKQIVDGHLEVHRSPSLVQ